MLSPSDFNNAVPQFTNGNYASNPINPQYIAEPDATSYNRGAEPLQTLPAQWWNWFLNKFTGRFNKVNIYVKNIFNELAQLLSLVNITPDGTEATPTTGQLKSAFQTEYPKYLALLMYPVGSIYWTGKAPDDGGDPNVLFGGTWVQIKGKFVWAKGDSDTLNATGGEKTHTLTTSEIPSHNHSFTPAGSVSVTTNPTFTGSEHSHSYTPAGTVSKHTHSVGAHAHGLNAHTHSVTAAGTISVTTNPTFTGSAVTSGVMSGNSTGNIRCFGSTGVKGNCSIETGAFGNTVTATMNQSDSGSQSSIKVNVAHTHSVTASGSISGGAYKFTGSAVTSGQASGSTANSTAFNSGETQPTFTGTTATLKATQGGTISGGAYKFTGTAGNTGSKGDGGAHNNMPPYVVKYCWERTA